MNVPLSDCHGQGYDNAANMSGKYNGTQAVLLEKNPLMLYSPCGCHSLNLCGNDSAKCCREAITFFGTIQIIFVFFHSSPKRWEVMKGFLHGSLHGLCDTRWSQRVKAVKAFKKNQGGITKSLKACLNLNLQPKAFAEAEGAIKYVESFECILMSCIWYPILEVIDTCNQIIQQRDATLDSEARNIEGK